MRFYYIKTIDLLVVGIYGDIEPTLNTIVFKKVSVSFPVLSPKGDRLAC